MESRQTQIVRYAVIGAGAAVMSSHMPALQLPEIQVVAVADVNEEPGRTRAQELNCPFYQDHRQLLADTHPDAVVITTPHPFHASIAIDCLNAGCHVLVEKPMAVHVAEADAMLAAAQGADRLLGVIFQHRFRPEIRAAYQLIQTGGIGQILHVDMSVAWTRTAAYYRSAGWRGTWRGEGGGVLMNQAPHHLDLLCHLVGLPSRVFAWTRRHVHAIETEDTVQAALEWENGALGSLHISTAEADPDEYFKFTGSRGQLELRNGQTIYRVMDSDITDFIASNQDPFASPAFHERPVQLDETVSGNHLAVYKAFTQAIVRGVPFTSALEQGRMSLELANACIYSSYSGQPVTLPLDRKRYTTLLADLRADAV